MTYQEMYDSNPSHETELYTATLQNGKISLRKETFRLVQVTTAYELIRKETQVTVLVRSAMSLPTEINNIVLSERNCVTVVSYDPKKALELIKNKLRYDMDVLTSKIQTTNAAIKQFSDFQENTKLFTRFLKENNSYNTYKYVIRQQVDSMFAFDFFKENTNKSLLPLTLTRTTDLQKKWNKFIKEQ